MEVCENKFKSLLCNELKLSSVHLLSALSAQHMCNVAQHLSIVDTIGSIIQLVVVKHSGQNWCTKFWHATLLGSVFDVKCYCV